MPARITSCRVIAEMSCPLRRDVEAWRRAVGRVEQRQEQSPDCPPPCSFRQWMRRAWADRTLGRATPTSYCQPPTLPGTLSYHLSHNSSQLSALTIGAVRITITLCGVMQSADCRLLPPAMDWPHYSPLLPAAEDELDLSHLTGGNFPLCPSDFSPPRPHASNLRFSPLSLPTSVAYESLPSPHLPALDPPVWPTTTSPPSPTASTVSSASSSISSDRSTHSNTPLPVPTHTSSHPARSDQPSTPVVPASLAVSPLLLRKLHRPALDSPNTPNESTTASRQRKRAAGSTLTAQQRAALKRQRHREIDANRIQREKAALKRLATLTTTTPPQQQPPSASADDRIDDEEEAEGRRDKVTVLEDSAKKIGELQRLVSRLTDSCNAQQANNRTLVLQLQMAIRQPPSPPASPRSTSSSHPLSLLPSSLCQQLDAHIGSASLHSTWFVCSSVPIFVVRCSTGCVLDMNERAQQESGWHRSHVLGRLLCPPYDLVVAHESVNQQTLNDLSPQRILVDGPDGRLVPARTQRQYERSKALIGDLYRGDKQHIFCIFRWQLKNGRVYEVKTALWTTSWLEVPCEGGGVRKRPESIFMVCSYSDAVCVEDDTPLSGHDAGSS